LNDGFEKEEKKNQKYKQKTNIIELTSKEGAV
jgi:hypothetical protein